MVSNLRPSSHGLFGKSMDKLHSSYPQAIKLIQYDTMYHLLCTGQFWNIPIRVSEVKGSTYIEVHEVGNSQYRRFLLSPHLLTWDNTKKKCYYAGNIHGAAEFNRDPSQSAIEGSHTQYQTSSFFDTTFYYRRFDDGLC